MLFLLLFSSCFLGCLWSNEGQAVLVTDKPTIVSKITYIPRNDDNYIRIGDMYELFYWDQGDWISLGTQTADDIKLVYHDVPSDAIYWLRNRTRGKEERPFTYENEKQVWW